MKTNEWTLDTIVADIEPVDPARAGGTALGAADGPGRGLADTGVVAIPRSGTPGAAESAPAAAEHAA